MQGKIDALAVSGYASVRNPAYELKVKGLSDAILGVPVVCAHELTKVLGYYERTVTAVLNAKLIPIIKELIAATKVVLAKKGIRATLVIIKGDGNCMTCSFAEERPIETVLSGPAASALGGILLSGCKDMIVADMGGTTLDVVPILDQSIPMDECGAAVGGWRIDHAPSCIRQRLPGSGRAHHAGKRSRYPHRQSRLCYGRKLRDRVLCSGALFWRHCCKKNETRLCGRPHRLYCRHFCFCSYLSDHVASGGFSGFVRRFAVFHRNKRPFLCIRKASVKA